MSKRFLLPEKGTVSLFCLSAHIYCEAPAQHSEPVVNRNKVMMSAAASFPRLSFSTIKLLIRPIIKKVKPAPVQFIIKTVQCVFVFQICVKIIVTFGKDHNNSNSIAVQWRIQLIMNFIDTWIWLVTSFRSS